MEKIADKIAEETGGDPKIILNILEEGFCTLTEILSADEKHLKGVKLTIPLTRRPELMVYSALASCVVIMRDVYKNDSYDAVMAGIKLWQDKTVSPITALSNKELLLAIYDDDFNGLYAKEIGYFKDSKQGGINRTLVLKLLTDAALKRGIMDYEEVRGLMEE